MNAVGTKIVRTNRNPNKTKRLLSQTSKYLVATMLRVDKTQKEFFNFYHPLFSCYSLTKLGDCTSLLNLPNKGSNKKH